jgi:hypothetical protein
LPRRYTTHSLQASRSSKGSRNTSLTTVPSSVCGTPGNRRQRSERLRVVRDPVPPPQETSSLGHRPRKLLQYRRAFFGRQLAEHHQLPLAST